jgi:uncharacterized membrane protein
MTENKELNENVIDELKKMNKRLNSMHSWLAGFIIVTILFYVYIVYYRFILP